MSQTQVLFIAGLGRSGSTLLERILGLVPEAVSVGEVVHLWERGVLRNERCGCGRCFHDCPFWTAVGESAFGGWDQVDVHRVLAARASVDRTRQVRRLLTGRGPATFRSQLAEFQAVLGPLYSAIDEVSGGRVVVDSSKNPSYAYVLRGLPGVTLRAIHVIRDAPAVAYSWSRVVTRPDATSGIMARWSARQTSLQWDVQNALAGALSSCNVPTELVRYEDLVRSPRAVVARVLDFARLAPSDQLLADLARGHLEFDFDHTVSGNPMRFATGRVSIRIDDEWRLSMRNRDRWLVKSLTAPGRAYFGYLRRETDPQYDDLVH